MFVAKVYAVTGYLTHPTMIPKYEAGRHRPGSAFVAAVAAYAGEPIDAFFD